MLRGKSAYSTKLFGCKFAFTKIMRVNPGFSFQIASESFNSYRTASSKFYTSDNHFPFILDYLGLKVLPIYLIWFFYVI
jgi:hypothetical protein